MYKHERAYRKSVEGKDWELNVLDALSEQEEQRKFSALPTSTVPNTRLRKRQKELSSQEIAQGLAQGVAEGAWNRKYRIERSRVDLKITSMCRCKYCENANPFQTHAYKNLESDIKEGKTIASCDRYTLPAQRVVKKRVSLDLTFNFIPAATSPDKPMSKAQCMPTAA